MIDTECSECGEPLQRKELRRPPKCTACKKKVHRACNRRWWDNNPGMSTQYSRDRRALMNSVNVE